MQVRRVYPSLVQVSDLEKTKFVLHPLFERWCEIRIDDTDERARLMGHPCDPLWDQFCEDVLADFDGILISNISDGLSHTNTNVFHKVFKRAEKRKEVEKIEIRNLESKREQAQCLVLAIRRFGP